MTTTDHYRVIIIGAGLSGLYAAWKLKAQQRHQQDVLILEARARTGGRILSPRVTNHADSCIDVGPAWVWPEFQPRVKALLSQLDIKVFKQYCQGAMLYDLGTGKVERFNGQSAHQHSYRIAGGAGQLITALQSGLTGVAIELNTSVTSIKQQHTASEATLAVVTQQNDTIKTVTANTVIVALPPRIAAKTIVFDPPLDAAQFRLWQSTPTWMAGHCKMVFVYDTPFWREQNLSGEVLSQRGPLAEIYDGSPEDESAYALTSFVGLSPAERKQIDHSQLKTLCLEQLQHLFGDASQQVQDIHIKDWSLDAHTTIDLDLQGNGHHPQYPLNQSRGCWNDKIILAGSEVAPEHGGYIEGALESAELAIDRVLSQQG